MQFLHCSRNHLTVKISIPTIEEKQSRAINMKNLIDPIDISELERWVIMTVAKLGASLRYGVEIQISLEKTTGKKVSIGALHTTLERLSKKGCLTSELGEASPERGGRKKRLYKVTLLGKRSVQHKIDIEKSLTQSWEPALHLA